MGLRRFKQSSLTDVARRWNRSPIPTGPEMGLGDPGERPSPFLTGGIILALAVMLGGVLWVWQSSPPSPASANTLVVPTHAGVTAALESARGLMAKSQWSRADAVLLEACVKFPEERQIRVARAECLSAMKQYGEAYGQYEKALAIGPREPDIEFAAGVAASKANLTDRATEHFSMAQAADPTNASYALMLGQAQRKDGNMEASKANLLRAAHLEPANAYVWGTLADISLAENNVNLSLQHIAKARTLQPDSSEWRVIEARGHKRKGDPERALSVLNAIEPRQRKDPGVARLISECYGMLGRPLDGATVLADASLASPTDGALAYTTALAFERAGNRVKAIEFASYAKANGHEGAAKLLAKLKQ